jgi:hypothetical protein
MAIVSRLQAMLAAQLLVIPVPEAPSSSSMPQLACLAPFHWTHHSCQPHPRRTNRHARCPSLCSPSRGLGHRSSNSSAHDRDCILRRIPACTVVDVLATSTAHLTWNTQLELSDPGIYLGRRQRSPVLLCTTPESKCLIKC